MAKGSGVLTGLAAGILASAAALSSGSSAVAADAKMMQLCITIAAAADADADADDLTPDALIAGMRDGSMVIVDVSEPAACAAPATAVPDLVGPDEADACYLVTGSEMGALFHRELIEPPSGTSTGGVRDCLWTFATEPLEMAVVWLGDYNGWADLAGLNAEAIEGIGDEALWVLDGQLWVRSGDIAFTVMVMSDTLDVRETAIAVARVALPRIR